MRKRLGMTLEEIARKFNITVADVRRVISSKELSKAWSEKDRKRQVEAGSKRAKTMKMIQDAKIQNKKLQFSRKEAQGD